jgi:hypothetical protein
MQTALSVGVSPLKALRAAKLAADIHRADGVQKRIGLMKGLASTDQHDVLVHILSLEAAKRESHAEELAALQAGEVKVSDCRIEVKHKIHAGVRICIGKGEMTIPDERENVTFYYDAGSGQVVQVTKG